MRTPPAQHRPRLPDLLVAGGFLAMLAGLVVVTPGGPSTPGGLAVALLCAVVQAGTLAFVRRHPERAMAAAAAAGVGIEALAPNVGWLGQVAAVLASYAAIRPPSRSLWVLGLLVAATPWKLASGGDWRTTALAAAGPALGWTLGELGRTRRLRRADLERRILTQERARIARELHDALTHTVAVIVVQAGAATDVFDTRPDLARKALEAIDHAARATLAELRVLLDTVSADAPAIDRDPAGPQPGLAQLADLAASLQAAGLHVDLDHSPLHHSPGAALPPAVDLSAYRIVQESLTNTLRHSHATRAQVTIHHSPDALHLAVHDPGPARTRAAEAPAATSGDHVHGLSSGRRGIVGMRERARLLGGTLDAGPAPDGGFRVTATLPVNGTDLPHPTGSAPAGSSPARSAPTGSAPAGSAPAGSAPTGSAPTGPARENAA